jgi:cytosine/adenosine deaminase-related metal-dependent hydrolase
MSPNTGFLLQGGTALLHQEDDQVVSKRMDILIRNNLIVAIAENIPQPEDVTEVIDCSDMIISPGLVDTHRHLWQTQLKGRYGDDLLPEYAARGYLAGYFFSSKDIQLGELSGILESIDAGTTTIVDQMHAVYSPAHIEAALEAMTASVFVASCARLRHGV